MEWSYSVVKRDINNELVGGAVMEKLIYMNNITLGNNIWMKNVNANVNENNMWMKAQIRLIILQLDRN